MRKHMLIAAVAALLGMATFASAASAADKNWSGFYGGLHGQHMSTSASYQNAGTPHQSLSGDQLGAQIGYNYEFDNNVVVGIEASLSTGDVKTDPIRDGNYIIESGKIDRSAFLRARIGYALGNWLPYATAGFAWERVAQQESCPVGASVPFGFCKTHGGVSGFDRTQSKTQTGYTLGAGVEYAIDTHWSLAGDYQYRHFASTTYNLGLDGVGTPLPPSTMNARSENVFGIRVNYAL